MTTPQDLRSALEALLNRYVCLVNSGDAGHWNPEDEADVKAARAALALSSSPAGEVSLPKGSRILDPNKVQLCRVGKHSADALAMGQPCDCPVATCKLWKGGLRSPDSAQALAHTPDHLELFKEAGEWAKSMKRQITPDMIELLGWLTSAANLWSEKVEARNADSAATSLMVKPTVLPDRVLECAARLVEHADFRLGGVLSADSKARDIPSSAYSQVKARHLASLRDALAARQSGTEVKE